MNTTAPFNLVRTLAPYQVRRQQEGLRRFGDASEYEVELDDFDLRPRKYPRLRRAVARVVALTALGALVYGVAVAAQSHPDAVDAVTNWATFGKLESSP